MQFLIKAHILIWIKNINQYIVKYSCCLPVQRVHYIFYDLAKKLCPKIGPKNKRLLKCTDNISQNVTKNVSMHHDWISQI